MRSSVLRDEVLQIFTALPLASRRSAWMLLILSLLTGVFEVLTIGAVFPIILSLTDPERLVQSLSRFTGGVNPALVEWLSSPVPVLLVFSAVVIMAGVIRLALVRQSAQFAHDAGTEISMQALKRILDQPFAYHVATTSTRTISLVTHKVSAVVNQVLIALIHLITSLVIAACVLAFLCFVNLAVSLIVLTVLLCTYLIVGAMSRRKLRRLGQETSEHQTLAIATVQESIGHVREMLLTGLQPFFLNRFRDHAQRYRQAQAQSMALTISKRHVVEIVVFLLMAALIYFLLQSSSPRENVLVTLGIFALAAQRLLPIVNQIYTAWANLENGRSPLSDLIATLDLSCHEASVVKPLQFNQSVALEGFDFKHPQSSRGLFHHQSIAILKGQRVGLMGPSGAGKTTLVDLLAGLHWPDVGSLSIDSKPLDRSDIESWQRSIGYVPQQVFLSDQTIAENIAIGTGLNDLNIERVRFAANAAGLDAWIESLPLGYQTVCGENGIRLSGGQRQRIGIARVLYAHKPVLILDEPTSALDIETESEIMDTIMKLDRDMTVIIVTHRQSLMRLFDQVFRVENGTITTVPADRNQQ